MNNLVDKDKLTYALNYVKTNGSVPKLTTARTIAISGGATGTATSFNGSTNITIPVTSLDATKLTGTASINTTGSAAKLTTARKIGDASFNGTANIDINDIFGTVSISSSGTAYVGQYAKFANVTLTSAYQGTMGKLLITTSESGTGVSGILLYYIRVNADITSVSITLKWETISDTAFANSIVAVKTADGVYDLYFSPATTYCSTRITPLKLYNASYITFTSATTYVKTVTAAATSTYSLPAASLTGTASINTTGTAQNAKAIIKTSSITEDADLDKMLTPGKYFISATCTNVPHSTSSTTAYGILYVISTGSSNTTNIPSGFQIFIHRHSLALTSNIAIRTYNTSAFSTALAGWTPWKYLMGHGEYIYSKQSDTSINLNSFTFPGIYYFANNSDYTVNNLPGSAINGWLIVLARQARTYCKQIFIRQGSDAWSGRMIYMRSNFNSSWSDWDLVYVGNGSIRWGTASPSGGDLDGHIYLKYS